MQTKNFSKDEVVGVIKKLCLGGAGSDWADYFLINLNLNRKDLANIKVVVEVIAKKGDVLDTKKAFDEVYQFCRAFKRYFEGEFVITFKTKHLVERMYIQFSVGQERNVDQINMSEESDEE